MLMAEPKGNDAPKPEMHAEIAALIGAIAKAFSIPDMEAIAAVERGAIAMDFGRDESGNPFVAATFGEQTARIYQGAIKHPKSDDSPGE